jgi:hypothetical protein
MVAGDPPVSPVVVHVQPLFKAADLESRMVCGGDGLASSEIAIQGRKYRVEIFPDGTVFAGIT